MKVVHLFEGHNFHVDWLKDRLGDQRGGGGSEWEPIKILLERD
jgi:hypothetical protein